MEPHQPTSEAGEAVRAAALASGLAVAPHEMRPLLKALGGRPRPPGRIRRAGRQVGRGERRRREAAFPVRARPA